MQKSLSPKELEVIIKYYGASPQGNYDTGKFSAIEKAAGLKGVHQSNIFFLKSNFPAPDLQEEPFYTARKKLLLIRNKRIRPSLDNQILTAWNGLMIAAVQRL